MAKKMSQSITVGKLRCEYLEEPLAVEVKKPRLSWVLESARRGVTQKAYRILVASSEELLENDKFPLS